MRYSRLGRLLALALALMLCLPMAVAEEDAGQGDAIAQEEDRAAEAQADALGEIDLALPGSEAADGEAAQNAAVEPVQVNLGVKQTYAIKVKGKKLTYKSSNKSVAKVSKKGVVTARKVGKATIRCYSKGKLKAKYTVVVVAAPKKVTLGVTKLTLGVAETFRLEPTITEGSLATFTWSTTRKKVAKVSKKGVVTGVKAGKATIAVTTQNGRTAKVAVTVKKAPGSLSLDRTSLTLGADGKAALKAKLPSGTASKITWTSSDEKVAKVDDGGVVTAVKAGKATITASTFNDHAATCAVRVLPKIDATVKYRALLIGEEAFSLRCTRNRGDIGLMANMLNNVIGLYGGSYSVTRKYDLDRDGVLDAIRQTFAKADDNDVSLFFIATHGLSDEYASDEGAGMLSLVPEDYGNTLTMGELAAALKAVPGKVIVILESCGSGAGVYANGAGDRDISAALEAFDRAAARAFADADPGVWVELDAGQLDSSGARAKTGELRIENKFYVLTASDYREDSWGTEYGPYNYFTHWLTQGVGDYGDMPADADGNGLLTLRELYRYISDVGDNYPIRYNFETYYQHVQVYPSDSGYVLFAR